MGLHLNDLAAILQARHITEELHGPELPLEDSEVSFIRQCLPATRIEPRILVLCWRAYYLSVTVTEHNIESSEVTWKIISSRSYCIHCFMVHNHPS